MKKIFIFLGITLLMSTSIFSQTTKDDIDYLQAVYGMEKRDVVAGFIQPNEITSDDFWQLYEEYEIARKVINSRRIELLLDYVDNYDTLSDDALDRLIKKTTKERSNLDKLINKYYKKINKTYGSKVAAQFMHIEGFILSVSRLAILESIPFIDSLEH